MILAINGRTYKELTSATNDYEAIGRYQKVANSKWLFFFFTASFVQPAIAVFGGLESQQDLSD